MHYIKCYINTYWMVSWINDCFFWGEFWIWISEIKFKRKAYLQTETLRSRLWVAWQVKKENPYLCTWLEIQTTKVKMAINKSSYPGVNNYEKIWDSHLIIVPNHIGPDYGSQLYYCKCLKPGRPKTEFFRKPGFLKSPVFRQ